MAAQHFRSAFNGFHREDVVRYIEYMNNQHRAQLEQLSNQLQLAQTKAAAPSDSELQAQLDAALLKISELEAQLAQTQQDLPAISSTEQELEAYRRAERTERIARERAQAIYEQANLALDGAIEQAQAASDHITGVADQVIGQLQEYQQSVAGTKEAFQNAVASLHALRPQCEE